MRKWIIWAALAACPLAQAQQPVTINSIQEMRAPVVKYPLNAQAGAYLLFVKSYKHDTRSQVSAQSQAEELAEYIRTAYRCPAYVHVKNWDEKVAEKARVDAEMQRLRAEYKKRGIEADGNILRVRTTKIEEEYAVLMGPPKGGWADMDQARKALDVVKKWKAPGEHLCDKIVVREEDPKTKTVEVVAKPVNPFLTTFTAPNPLVPRNVEADIAKTEKEEVENLKKLNDGGDYNLFRARKNWTLVVNGFSGSAAIKTENEAPGVLEKLFGAKSSLLDAGAKQAEEQAKLLTSVMADPKATFKSKVYVMHTRSGSLVCMGEFDGPEDPALAEAKRKIAGMQLKNLTPISNKDMRDPLAMIEPGPMKIPGR